MTRRPRSRRPPRLDALAAFTPTTEPAEPTPVSLGRQLAERRVTGLHARLGRAEVSAVVGRLAAGHVDATLGLDIGRITREEAEDALQAVWGTDPTAARMTIEPDHTTDAIGRVAARLTEVARERGRVALATGRPASLLGCYAAIAAALDAAGARVVDLGAYGPFHGSRWLWWVDGVAVVTDGASLLADAGLGTGDEWLFAVGRPDLLVCDRGFAAAGVTAGIETIALADLDAVALGVAERRQHPVRVVPVDEQRPPGAYDPLVEALTAPLATGPQATGPQATGPQATGPQATGP
jgi:hypothetical protein